MDKAQRFILPCRSLGRRKRGPDRGRRERGPYNDRKRDLFQQKWV
jgi:hypothetical protein